MTEAKMQLVDWLDDLCVRFIINLPQEELESVERICFQVEEAQWFYEDFIRPLDPSLPSMNLRSFCLRIFQHCPLLSEFSPYHHSTAFSEFLAYKTRVPVRGAIMLNQGMDEVVLVKGWKKGANWSFPRGKINKDEKDLDCAIREVYEETGFDVRDAGLVKDEAEMKYIEVTMREQHMRLYIFRGVPTDAQFEPRTRKEISKIQWYKLSDLPTFKKSKQGREGTGEDLAKGNKFYMVAPFLVPLKKWISQQHKLDARRPNKIHEPVAPANVVETQLGSESTAEDEFQANGAVMAEQTGAAGENDLDRLFAHLRSSVPPPQQIPQYEQSLGVVKDPAAELKRLLSVNATTKPNVPTEAPWSDLLPTAPMVGSAPTRASAQQTLPPHTPLDQISSVVPQPESPAHQRQSQPLLDANMEIPPRFPRLSEQQVQVARPGQNWPGQSHRMPAHGYSKPLSTTAQPVFTHGPPLQPSMPSINPALSPQKLWEPTMGPQNRVQAITSVPTIPGSTRTNVQTTIGRPSVSMSGDDNVVIEGSIKQKPSMPIVPPASTLPLPKLNSHTLSLLNTFKSSEKQAARGPIDTAEDRGPNFPEVATQKLTINDAARQLPQNQAVAVTSPVAAPIIPSILSDKTVNQRIPRSNNAHQDALLDLFRTSSTAGSGNTGRSMDAATLQIAGPVELSANASPGNARSQSSRQVSSTAAASAKAATPVAELANTPLPAALTSATLSGPLNDPNFQAIRGQTKLENVNRGLGMLSLSAHDAKTLALLPQDAGTGRFQDRMAQIDVLNRNSSQPTKVKSNVKDKARYPQPLHGPINPIISNSVATDFDAAAAKRSVSHKARPSTPRSTGPRLNSPVSPLPDRKSGEYTPVNDAITSQTQDAIAMAQGGQNTKSGGTGKGTPVTPVDKSFLLGYLEDVVKGAR